MNEFVFYILTVNEFNVERSKYWNTAGHDTSSVSSSFSRPCLLYLLLIIKLHESIAVVSRRNISTVAAWLFEERSGMLLKRQPRKALVRADTQLRDRILKRFSHKVRCKTPLCRNPDTAKAPQACEKHKL